MLRTGTGTFYSHKTICEDYAEEVIRERIAGKSTRTVKAAKAERKGVDLLVDIEN